ncbi:hypothetical protein Taro_006830 [Colocasia esculenta]|uniref:Uncharacterized protein n=1 Tax=Colocasia esculenta TaxID=4460 RepID=A0A843TYR7_COLES|nr:hypothetical protein [Colocasia esculenta]
MAASLSLFRSTSPSRPPPPLPQPHPQLPSVRWPLCGGGRHCGLVLAEPAVYKVTMEHNGETMTLEVEDETILGRLLEEGMDSEGMLSDDVVESDYALLYAAYPLSDYVTRTIPEEEFHSLQLATAND